MQIVIDIPEEDYKKIIEYGECDYLRIINAIENGTPLPKGHDVLIDRGELKKIIQENDPLSMTGFSVGLCDIYRATPIIEEDKEKEEC